MNTKYLMALIAICTSCAALDLDSMMTPEEKKKTGYSSLSKEKKKELNAWLTKHTVPIPETRPKTTLSLDVNIQFGSELVLSDGTKWIVAPEDKSISSLWLTPIPLLLVTSDSPDYPKILINLDSQKEKVKVKPAP